MYDSICSVTIQEKYEKENGSTGFRDTMIIDNQPCKLQFSTVDAAQQGDAMATVSQVIRLFISPDVYVPAGSKITINAVDYTHSGAVAMYNTHQEIVLKLLDRWS